MTSKPILLALLATTLVPAFAAAHTQCTYGDFGDGCVSFGSWSYDQGCDQGGAGNYAQASLRVGDRGESAGVGSSCAASRERSNNTTSASEYRSVQAYAFAWGPKDGHGASLSWYEYHGAWDNLTYENCRVALQAGQRFHDRACPGGLAPPALPALLP